MEVAYWELAPYVPNTPANELEKRKVHLYPLTPFAYPNTAFMACAVRWVLLFAGTRVHENKPVYPALVPTFHPRIPLIKTWY